MTGNTYLITTADMLGNCTKLGVPTCFIALLILFSTQIARAANEPDKVPRFGVEVGLGTESFLKGFLQGKLLYTLPVWENRLTTYLLYTKPWAISYIDTPPNFHQIQMGAKFYFVQKDIFRPYAAIQGGIDLEFVQQQTPSINAQPLFFMGVGSDFMFTEHFGLTVGLLYSITYPMIVPRPELNFKAQF